MFQMRPSSTVCPVASFAAIASRHSIDNSSRRGPKAYATTAVVNCISATTIPNTVSSRLKVFHAETEPLILYYRETDLIQTVDGQAAPEVVNVAVMAKIQTIRSRKSA